MAKANKILEAARSNPASVSFSDLVRLVEAMGYSFKRQTGSHQIFSAPGMPMINLQKKGNMAKSYQVEQVLAIIDERGIVIE